VLEMLESASTSNDPRFRNSETRRRDEETTYTVTITPCPICRKSFAQVRHQELYPSSP
jgi:tRNA(Arg) A34 adenosine deaminase TadA